MTQLAVPHATRAREREALTGPPAVLASLTWLAALTVAVVGLFGSASSVVADIFQVIGTFGVAWMLMHTAYGSPDLSPGLRVLAVSLVLLGAADVASATRDGERHVLWLTTPYLASTLGLVTGTAVLAWGHARRRDAPRTVLALALVGVVAAVAGSQSADLVDGSIDRSWTLVAALVGSVAAVWAHPRRDSDETTWDGSPERPAGSEEAHVHAESPRASSQRAERGTADAALSPDEVRLAIEEHRLLVGYQPVVDLATGRVVGAEALVRIVEPTGELVTAERFLPAAHGLGLMPYLTATVLERACADFASEVPTARAWWVAVNLAEEEIVDPVVRRQILAATERSGLPAHRLVIEVTERALPGVQTRLALNDIASTGVRIALDDFGSRWSSFAQLWSLPLDIVKLDRELVADARAGRMSGMLAPVISVARELDLVILAEGIEDDSEVQPLRDAGCRLGQGYAWGPAVPIDRLVANCSGPSASDPHPGAVLAP